MYCKLFFVFAVVVIGCSSTERNRTSREVRYNAADENELRLLCQQNAQKMGNANNCASQAGCRNGYCWAWCGFSLSGGAWCYTTRAGYTMSREYVSCTSDADCDRCWKCGGPCAYI